MVIEKLRRLTVYHVVPDVSFTVSSAPTSMLQPRTTATTTSATIAAAPMLRPVIRDRTGDEGMRFGSWIIVVAGSYRYARLIRYCSSEGMFINFAGGSHLPCVVIRICPVSSRY